jgi:UDP-N-acetylglucosamine:LPS N-acetylglucosamine transferase
VVHEQNSVAGLANRVLAGVADRVSGLPERTAKGRVDRQSGARGDRRAARPRSALRRPQRAAERAGRRRQPRRQALNDAVPRRSLTLPAAESGRA